MKKIKVLIGVIFLLVAFSVTSIAATIGYIEVGKVFTEYKETKKAQEKLDQRQKEFKAKLEEKQEEIDKARREGKSETEVRDIIKDMEKELDPEKEELIKMNDEMTKKLQGEIVKAVESVGKELGIDVVLDKRFVITGGVDLTDMVLTKLNKKK
ncbi:MAG: OmpH family outer membrane protein [Candidatus Margulisbacteria bacterium]|nr:OmpH family outer membrane protein [Candidatus Margulisiibacteriota bacterium]